MEKYQALANMSSRWQKVIGVVARPNCTADKQMHQKIKKLFTDLTHIEKLSGKI